MNFQGMSDKAILAELGQRIQRERINRNRRQSEVASKAGVSRRTVQKLEAGLSFTVAVLIRILRALNKLDALDAFLPEPGLSPVQLAKFKGRVRQRAYGRRGKRRTRR